MTANEKTVHSDITPEESAYRLNAVERTHIDGTVDLVDQKAIGGDLDQFPEGYFRSSQFIGTVFVCQGKVFSEKTSLTSS